MNPNLLDVAADGAHIVSAICAIGALVIAYLEYHRHKLGK
jgi:hypothetical protein